MGLFGSRDPRDPGVTTRGERFGGDGRNGSSPPAILRVGRVEARTAFVFRIDGGFGSASAIISVVVPAHDEEQVITRCLRALTGGTAAEEVEVIVVCNGCSDRTADVARRFGGP